MRHIIIAGAIAVSLSGCGPANMAWSGLKLLGDAYDMTGSGDYVPAIYKECPPVSSCGAR
jgi:hypothetical protein